MNFFLFACCFAEEYSEKQRENIATIFHTLIRIPIRKKTEKTPKAQHRVFVLPFKVSTQGVNYCLFEILVQSHADIYRWKVMHMSPPCISTGWLKSWSTFVFVLTFHIKLTQQWKSEACSCDIYKILSDS